MILSDNELFTNFSIPKNVLQLPKRLLLPKYIILKILITSLPHVPKEVMKGGAKLDLVPASLASLRRK